MRPAWQHCESDEGDPAFEIERETKIAVGEEPCVLHYDKLPTLGNCHGDHGASLRVLSEMGQGVRTHTGKMN